MLKRTKGRLLITLLVVTGLAGTINNNSISQQERKYVLSLLKDSKNNLLDGVEKLSGNQLNYKSPLTKVSVKNCLIQTALTEKKIWGLVSAAMKQPANPEKRVNLKLSDKELVEMAECGQISMFSTNTFKQANSPWKNIADALAGFKNMRNEHIRYMKSSTEDLRNHVILTPAGWVDCYQLILLLSATTNHCAQVIENIKAEESFPGK